MTTNLLDETTKKNDEMQAMKSQLNVIDARLKTSLHSILSGGADSINKFIATLTQISGEKQAQAISHGMHAIFMVPPQQLATLKTIMTKAGMTRQLMVQVRSYVSFCVVMGGGNKCRHTHDVGGIYWSTYVLRKLESEYKGHHILLMCNRNILSTMQRQDVIDRVIFALGIFLFTCAVLYVVSKRIGIPKLQRQVRAAFNAGMVRKELGPGAVGNDVNHAPPYEGPVNKVEEPLERLMHDEL